MGKRRIKLIYALHQNQAMKINITEKGAEISKKET